MTKKITLVGCGFLGSLCALELTKRLWAFEEPCEWLLVDGDKVDERNPANQIFNPGDIGRSKSEVLGEALQRYSKVVELCCTKVGQTQDGRKADEYLLFDNASLVIDAVDNIPTRQWLWEAALRTKIPVMHLGVGEDGNGVVQWTVAEPFYDTFSLAPTQLQLQGVTEEQLTKMSKVKKLKPCELVGFRGVGLNLAVAGAKAAAIALYGFNPENEDGLSGTRAYTTWSANNYAHTLIETQVL